MAPEVNYVKVTFRDQQNGQSKTYQLQTGSVVRLTNSVYTVNLDQTIDVTLPQLSAISLWDANKDNTIDEKDSKILKAQEGDLPEENDGMYHSIETFADKLNNALMASKSRYHVDGDAGGSFGGFAENGSFSVCFRSNIDENDTKYIGIDTANYLEQMDADADERYAKKHWFRNFLGITREKYEENHKIDY